MKIPVADKTQMQRERDTITEQFLKPLISAEATSGRNRMMSATVSIPENPYKGLFI